MHESTGQRSWAVRLWTAINRSPRLTLGFVLAFYLVLACVQAATRLLWGDELITLAIANTGSLSGIWRELSLGADPNPPLSHAAVLISTRIFGQSALAVRLPAIVAMLLAILCVWAILRRWVAPGFAAVGVLAFTATRGFDYSYEARSYAPLAGFSMAAVLCWLWATDHLTQTAADTTAPAKIQSLHRRLAALAGMTFALALAVSSNYYGVLAWFPIAAGELVLSFRLRRIFPATWLCLALAALPLWAYLPLIRHNLAEFGPHAWNRPQLSMLTESYLVLVEGVLWPVLLGAAWLSWKRRSVHAAQTRGPQPQERIALGLLLAYPVLGLALASAKSAMISPRCVIPVCCAFGIAVGLLSSRSVRGARAALALLFFGVLWVTARESACAVLLYRQRTALFALVQRISSAPPGPIYISDSSLVLPLAHYGGQRLRDRLVFPIDFAAIHTWEPEDSGEQNLWAGRAGVFPFRVVPYGPELARTRPALVIARPGGWLTHNLAESGIALTDQTTSGDLRALGSLGGVFTPMAHQETRLLAPSR